MLSDPKPDQQRPADLLDLLPLATMQELPALNIKAPLGRKTGTQGSSTVSTLPLLPNLLSSPSSLLFSAHLSFSTMLIRGRGRTATTPPTS